MISIDVPGWKTLRLEQLVLDVNGTLTLDGGLLPDIAERIRALRPHVDIHLLSADTHGRLDEVAAELKVARTRLEPGDEVRQKADFVCALGAERVVAIGNGANDVGMLEEAVLGIVVLGPEGLAGGAWAVADIMTGDAGAALDLLLHPARIRATLRR